MASFYVELQFNQQERKIHGELTSVLDKVRNKVRNLCPEARVGGNGQTSMIIGEGRVNTTNRNMMLFNKSLQMRYLKSTPFINTLKYFVGWVTPNHMPGFLQHRNCKSMLVLVPAQHTMSALNYYIFNERRDGENVIYEKKVSEGGVYAMFPIAEFKEDEQGKDHISSEVCALFPGRLVSGIPENHPQREIIQWSSGHSIPLHSMTIYWISGGFVNIDLFWDEALNMVGERNRYYYFCYTGGLHVLQPYVNWVVSTMIEANIAKDLKFVTNNHVTIGVYDLTLEQVQILADSKDMFEKLFLRNTFEVTGTSYVSDPMLAMGCKFGIPVHMNTQVKSSVDNILRSIFETTILPCNEIFTPHLTMGVAPGPVVSSNVVDMFNNLDTPDEDFPKLFSHSRKSLLDNDVFCTLIEFDKFEMRCIPTNEEIFSFSVKK